MIRICRERAEENEFADFGVVYHHERRSSIGCTVRIGDVLKTYSDGRMEIITLGQRRFEIKNILHDQEFEQADVTWMVDEHPDWEEDLANEAFGLHRMLIRSITGSFPPDDHYSGQSALSFLIAQSSGLTFDLKQAVLESRSENNRLQLLIEHLRELLPMVDTVDAARTSIHNNWAMHQALKPKLDLD
jgi:Lon protease-like protein